MKVAVVDTGIANLASVRAGLERAEMRPFVTADPSVVAEARAVVLPGVGAFGPAMKVLRESGLARAIRERVMNARPTLAICLGLQLLADASDEAPGVEGIGVVPGIVRPLPSGSRSPHLGWNRVDAEASCGVLSTGYAAFANGFAMRDAPAGWRCARFAHGVPLIAAVERGPVVACQFHPELSGRYGRGLLERWRETC